VTGTLWVTGDDEADRLLNTDGTALLVGMVLDQQIPLAWAFRGPATLRDRLGHLDASRIAAMDPEAVVAVAATKPAVHRYPAAMGRRVHELCRALVDDHGGDGARVWAEVRNGEQLRERLLALPGFGDEKSRITVAVLAKRFAIRPPGWEVAAGVFADDQPRSVADCASPTSYAAVKAWKKDQKAAGWDKQDRPLPSSPGAIG